MKLSRHSAQKSRLRSASWRRDYPQLLSVFLLLLLGQTVLGLSDLEFAFTEEGNEADSKVGTSQV